tara:strand:- start:4989 stop:5279 length:291 start_codon:yes stop_codon:yes gene_type:complete
MGRWDTDTRTDTEVLGEFRALQLSLLHHRDRRKNALGTCEVEKVDSKIEELYHELRNLYERNHGRMQDLMSQERSDGFESFAWFLMLSENTRKVSR